MVEIPPEQRDAARAFVRQARDLRDDERRRWRMDVATFALLGSCVAINVFAAATATSVVYGTLSMIVVALVSALIGAMLIRVSDRRGTYRAMTRFADETETALAFHDLDEGATQ